MREVTGERFLPIFIGSPEATAIVHAMQAMSTPRPMTHDLFKNVLDGQAISLRQIEITALHDGTFFAVLELVRDGAVIRVDARPSDAIALVVRFGVDEVPIYVADEVLEEAGVLLPDEGESDDPPNADAEVELFRDFLDTVSPEDFAP